MGRNFKARSAVVHANGPTPVKVSLTLHLVTQRGQPYGSVRKCCERCGSMRVAVGDHVWTADEGTWRFPPDGYVNCTNATKDPSQ